MSSTRENSLSRICKQRVARETRLAQQLHQLFEYDGVEDWKHEIVRPRDVAEMARACEAVAATCQADVVLVERAQ